MMIEEEQAATRLSAGDPISLGERSAKEWKCSCFNLIEPNGKVLHVRRMFVKSNKDDTFCCSRILLYRTAVFLSTLAYFFWSWRARYTMRVKYVVYLTRWNVIGILLFHGAAIILTLWPKHFLKQPSVGKGERVDELDHRQQYQAPPLLLQPHPLARLVWILNSALIPIQFLVILAYWIFMSSPNQQLGMADRIASFVDHGVIPFVFLLDGTIWHRIPVRLHHTALTYAILFAYVVVYFIYAPITSDSIYETGQWYQTLLLFGATGILFIPLTFLFSWCISLLTHSSSSSFWSGWSLDGSHRPTVDSSHYDTEEELDRTRKSSSFLQEESNDMVVYDV